ncbi:2-octaprenyl-3-methyl-6-methoxy-1,4-benzoquinol hydroxylase [Kushneria avicenniae]|uniref:2-octaprenyl-3-methyl-6-methoxy-1,4-benzoquinol hydroxylase n=1 Tax=Kushneria avicenniae TaxID=402385 RepID=A0A1I1JNK9_9GAMM|nr:FAD-dependent monooxygenase [Kushneria avicenniae]SFC47000.1 2-octaprenyl-3-methyl-6-methoxy-1,4-benzoquinol hydroxylase [Kushneria avicenniae]
MTDTSTITSDIIIVGGGIAGLAMAARLAHRTAFTITVLDSDRAPGPVDETLQLRTTSLNSAALDLLKDAGVMAHLPTRFLTDFDRLEAGSREAPEALSFSAADIDLDRFGVFVENDRLRHALWQTLEAQPRVTLISEARLSSLQRHDDHVDGLLDDGRALTTRLIIGADGARSQARHLGGISSQQRDYAQEAMIINVRLTESPGHTTWQIFTPSGPVALLPLHDRQASLIWYDSPGQVQKRMSMSDDALRAAIAEAFPARLGSVEAILERGRFPIRRLHAQRYAGKRLVLIGDAAHVIHPMAGQGVNLGLADVVALTEALEQESDPGAGHALSRYQRRQWPRNAAMLAGVEQLHHLFTLPFAPLRHLAERGLKSADRMAPVKRFMMSLATGQPMTSGKGCKDHDTQP